MKIFDVVRIALKPWRKTGLFSERSVKMMIAGGGALFCAVTLSACGENSHAGKVAQWLKGYYAENPPNGNWVAREVRAESGKKIIVDVLIPSQQQVDQIKKLSRMEQFTVAKLACPKNGVEIQKAYREGITVWIQLNAKSEALTRSICPHR
ncbi:hypothetical protein [Varunaivibrio sulfuroxidans]|uniref:hypothetical protein n=1 Tax=Varunaivibrio sulfuroxidans TaxID=1773489 RepID=UPI00104F0868|nr:hypothetical protein [Varunaivibrio sulfuroxidans]